jgi:hypothetical protein
LFLEIHRNPMSWCRLTPEPTGQETPRGKIVAARYVVFVAAAWLLLFLGCTPLEPRKSSTGPKFVSGRMTNDSVALEIGLVQLDDSQVELFEQFWKQLDHQKIDVTVRKRLDQNGLRVGSMPSHPSAAFLELIQPRPGELESLDLVEQQMLQQGLLEPKSRMIIHQRIVNRRSDTYKVATSESHPHYEWRVRRSNQDSFGSGETVQAIMEINTSPHSDGTANIRLTPRINYGPVQALIGVGERGFAYDSGQAGQSFSDLAMEVVLRAGETIVLAPTPDRSDLGHLFFESIRPPLDPTRTESHLTHRFLLVRLVQTQLDDLFGHAPANEPLTTDFGH